MNKTIVIIAFFALFVMLSGCIKTVPKNTDYSCNTDADCVAKTINCDCCGAITHCANKNSETANCTSFFDFFEAKCQCIHALPNACECINNRCQDVLPA